MIDPTNITNFDRTDIDLQEYFLFCVCVAGKTSFIQAQKLETFLQPGWFKIMTPFEYIDYLIEKDQLIPMIYQSKLGQYKRLTKIFKICTSIDLETVTLEELEKIPGIGPKTSRFFLLHTRPNQRFAVLDTHVLSWLGKNTKDNTIPSSTPQSTSRYKRIEELFLKEADYRNLTPENFDLQIWREQSRKEA